MANIPPHQQPAHGALDSQPPESQAASGTQVTGLDPTLEPGNYDSSLFGVRLPQGTGAPGSAGAAAQADPTLEPGQNYEGLSGLTPAQTADTGAPGSAGAQNAAGGGQAVTYTRPSAGLGTYQQETARDDISGPDDWTQAIDGSYGGGPQLPGVSGNMPSGTGAGDGRVLRGGRPVS